jgi:hypothetical protein
LNPSTHPAPIQPPLRQLHPTHYAAPRYQISLSRVDLDPSQPEVEPMGLSRGRVVGLRTATIFLEPDEAERVLDDWLIGGDGERALRWRGSVIQQTEL